MGSLFVFLLLLFFFWWGRWCLLIGSLCFLVFEMVWWVLCLCFCCFFLVGEVVFVDWFFVFFLVFEMVWWVLCLCFCCCCFFLVGEVVFVGLVLCVFFSF